MIINYFYLACVAAVPLKYDAPLLVDADAIKIFKLPDSFSSLFAGGILKSAISSALFSILNFRRAICCISIGSFLALIPFQISSVSFEPNDNIISLALLTSKVGIFYFIKKVNVNCSPSHQYFPPTRAAAPALVFSIFRLGWWLRGGGWRTADAWAHPRALRCFFYD